MPIQNLEFLCYVFATATQNEAKTGKFDFARQVIRVDGHIKKPEEFLNFFSNPIIQKYIDCCGHQGGFLGAYRTELLRALSHIQSQKMIASMFNPESIKPGDIPPFTYIPKVGTESIEFTTQPDGSILVSQTYLCTEIAKPPTDYSDAVCYKSTPGANILQVTVTSKIQVVDGKVVHTPLSFKLQPLDPVFEEIAALPDHPFSELNEFIERTPEYFQRCLPQKIQEIQPIFNKLVSALHGTADQYDPQKLTQTQQEFLTWPAKLTQVNPGALADFLQKYPQILPELTKIQKDFTGLCDLVRNPRGITRLADTVNTLGKSLMSNYEILEGKIQDPSLRDLFAQIKTTIIQPIIDSPQNFIHALDRPPMFGKRTPSPTVDRRSPSPPVDRKPTPPGSPHAGK